MLFSLISDSNAGIVLNSRQPRIENVISNVAQSAIIDHGETQVQHLSPTSINEEVQLSQPQLIDSSQGIPNSPTVFSISDPEVIGVGQPRFVSSSQPQIIGFSGNSGVQQDFFNSNSQSSILPGILAHESGLQNVGLSDFSGQSFGRSDSPGVVGLSQPQVLSVSQPQVLSVSQPQIQ